MQLDRRTLLGLAGVTATSTAIGGCLDTVGLADEDHPGYEHWLATDDDGTITFAAVDLAALRAFDDLEREPEDDPDGFADDAYGDSEDAMLSFPMTAILVVGLGVGVGLWGTGLSGLVGGDDEDEFESSIDHLLWVNGAYVLAGEIDPDEIDEELTTAPDEIVDTDEIEGEETIDLDDIDIQREYERTDEIDGYDVYESASRAGSTIAVGDDAIVFANELVNETDAVETIRGPIEAGAGDRERATDEREAFAWLLENAGDGQVAFGGYGGGDETDEIEDGATEIEDAGDAEFSELEGATGFASSLTIDGTTGASGEFAAIFDELDAEVEADLEAMLGSSAAEASVDVEDGRVTASATWDEDVTGRE